MPLNTIALSILIITIGILLYVVFSKRGWNCTENGCVYAMGGSFSTYDQCNSVCKPNGNENNQKQVASQVRNQSNDIVGLDTGMQPHYAYVPPMPYYSYLPGPFYHDHHWYKRDKKHRESGGNKNHNENHIFINSPTGPNLN